jgi:hypothetical protein
MLLTNAQIKKIKQIIENGYKSIGLQILKGDDKSLLELAYGQAFLNPDQKGPKTIKEIKAQQKNLAKLLPTSSIYKEGLEALNSNFEELIEKHKSENIGKFVNLLNNANLRGRNEALQNVTDPGVLTKKMESDIKSQLKQQLRDITGDSNRSFERVVTTELSNSIGLGSVDRISKDNEDKKLTEVYVYRIAIQDAATCAACKRLYIDKDGSPKVYKLSEVLSNGSNYGRTGSDLKAVSGATHPNERCSGWLEVKPGFKVLKDGSQTYMGLKDWSGYIKSKVQ